MANTVSSKEFCTYITTYSGNLLPPFYIGSTSVKRINEGYRGSVTSRKYKSIWKLENLNNPHLFKTRILTYHGNRKQAFIRENQFHWKLKVIKNPLYVNQTVANLRFGMYQEGKPKTTTHRENISKALKNKPKSEIAKHRMSVSAKKRIRLPISELHKIKISLSKVNKKRKPFSDEWKTNLSIANRRGNNSNAIPVEINGIKYSCKKDAEESLNLTNRQLNKLLKCQKS